MRILLTNDDGINAPGLWAAAKALKEVGKVIVVAPDREQSGIGTAVTLHQPIRVFEVRPQIRGVKTYAVQGTPSDSVIVGLETLIKGNVDLLVSGINQGANLGEDIVLSGTVSAALQGYFRKIPSLALSVTALRDVKYGPAALLAKSLAQSVGEDTLPRPILLNVNLPNLALDEIEGIEVTELGHRVYRDTINEGHDGRHKYYWIKLDRPVREVVEGSDVWAVRNKRISITPLHTLLATLEQLDPWRRLSQELFNSLKADKPA